MTRYSFIFLFYLGLTSTWVFGNSVNLDERPRVYKISPKSLMEAKLGYLNRNYSHKASLELLFKDAAVSLKAHTPSVMEKAGSAASGNKHDYLSQAPYYWIDPKHPEAGYVRKDGEHNPEATENSDSDNFKIVCAQVETLALAYYISGDEKYAQKATQFLRVWFLNPATQMNPNLNYGQGIPGQVEGRPQGLISVACLVDCVDALGLLEESRSWTSEDRNGMKQWLSAYFTWLTTSKMGLGEKKAKNNHGTLYDTQAVALALYLGKSDFAKNLLRSVMHERIDIQITHEGKQPLELARTRSLHYSLKNLQGLVDLATMAEAQGIDLWHYESPQGGSILKAIQFLAPYADDKNKWPYKQIDKVNFDVLLDILQRSLPHYPNSHLEQALSNFDPDDITTDRRNILYF